MILNSDAMEMLTGLSDIDCETTCTVKSCSVVVKRLPIIGRIQLVKDRNGLTSMLFILFCWFYTWSTCSLVIQLPAYSNGDTTAFLTLVHTSLSILTIISILRTSTQDPGAVSGQSVPSDTSEWVKCRVCYTIRPPRSHHCSRCQQCVARMDHHCPWVNNCIGAGNHHSFMLMVLYSLSFSALSLIIAIRYIFVYPDCVSCNMDVWYLQYRTVLVTLLTIETSAFTIVLFFLLLNQHCNLLLDRTYIETLSQPRHDLSNLRIRPFCSVYTNLCGTSSALLWFLPWRTKPRPYSNVHNVV